MDETPMKDVRVEIAQHRGVSRTLLHVSDACHFDTSDEIVRWILSSNSRKLPLDEFVYEMVRRVEQGGIHLARLTLFLPNQHPQVPARLLVWIPEQGMVLHTSPSELTNTPAARTPASAVHAGLDEVRLRLAGPDTYTHFDECRELAAQGATDIFLLALLFSDQPRGSISWATTLGGGFSGEHLSRLRSISAAMTLRIELDALRFAAESQLVTFLGPTAAKHGGRGIRREGTTSPPVRCVLCVCSLLGLEALTDTAPAPDVGRLLDEFYRAIMSPMMSRGGEILEMLDGSVLVAFPLPDGQDFFQCQRALSAARHAVDLTRTLEPVLPIGVALHVGELLCVAVGVFPRLTFVHLGKAREEVRRIGALGVQLGEPLLASEPFARAAGTMQSLGLQTLSGRPEPQEVFRFCE